MPARPALAGVAAVTGLSVAQAMLIDVPSAQAISVPLVTVVAGMIVIAVVRQVTLTRELAASRQTAERLAAEAERLRLARELHDSVKQQAFLAALEVASARSRFGPDGHLDAAGSARSVPRSTSSRSSRPPRSPGSCAAADGGLWR